MIGDAHAASEHHGVPSHRDVVLAVNVSYLRVHLRLGVCVGLVGLVAVRMVQCSVGRVVVVVDSRIAGVVVVVDVRLRLQLVVNLGLRICRSLVGLRRHLDQRG